MEMTLTNNFWTCVYTWLFGSSNSTVGQVLSSSNGIWGTYLQTLGTFTDINGNSWSQVAGIMQNNYTDYDPVRGVSLELFKFDSTHGTYFVVGSSPTENDYSIDSPISNATITFTGQNSANGSVTYHVIVTATASITISEICMVKKLHTSSYRDSSTSSYDVLIGRCVLDMPVELTNGESKTFDVTLSLPMPA